MWKPAASLANGYGLGCLRAALAAVICIVLAAAPARAQLFDFLFGRHTEEKPPATGAKPAESKPGGTTGAQTSGSKGKHHKDNSKNAAVAKPQANAPAPVEEPLPPYDTELLRLAEILGALTYLDEICTASSAGDWRAKMQALLEAEAKTDWRKQRLAGSYNRGFHDYERTYHFCTPNAQAAIGRFLSEGGKIAHEVVHLYGAS
jgi:uncharacterized protein (TIGR02301 family)